MTAAIQEMPHDVDLERSLLGACMLQAEAEHAILAKVEVEDFCNDQERVVCGLLKDMSAAGEPLAPDAVVARLREKGLLQRVGGTQYVVEVIGLTPAIAPSRMGRFLWRLRELAKRRRLIAECRTLMAEAYDSTSETTVSGLVDDAQGRLQALSMDARTSTCHTLKDSTTRLFQSIQAEIQAKTEGRSVAASTGLTSLDARLGGGMRGGELIIVAGRASMGKTAFALGMATAVSETKTVPRLAAHIISAETVETKLAARIIGTEARMAMSTFMSGEVRPEAWRKLTATSQWASKLPITTDDRSSPTIQQIRASVRWAQVHHRKVDAAGNETQRLGCLVVDYLQLIKPASNRNSTREQDVTTIAYELLGIAKDFDIPVVALSQLSRAVESRSNKRPMMSDLRESGGIEQAASVVLGLYRDDYYNPDSKEKGITEVLVLKNKDGATGQIMVQFAPEWMRFSDLEKDEYYGPTH